MKVVIHAGTIATLQCVVLCLCYHTTLCYIAPLHYYYIPNILYYTTLHYTKKCAKLSTEKNATFEQLFVSIR